MNSGPLASSRARFWSLVGAGTSALLLQCGPHIPAERPLPGTAANGDAPVLPGAQIERIIETGRPTLHMIRRSGDPKAAVAVAVFPPGGTAASIQLSQLIHRRLNQLTDTDGAALSVHSIGFIVAAEMDSEKAGAAWIAAVHQALSREVTPKEVQNLDLAAYLGAAATRVEGPSHYRACMGQLGAEGRTPLQEALSSLREGDARGELESLRKASMGAGRIGLAALGEAPFLKAIASAHDQEWTPGRAPDDSWSPMRKVGVIDSAGGRELRVALRVSDAEAALAGIRALRMPSHPLHARLAALDSHLTAGSMEVALRPAGACAGLTIRIADSSPKPSVLSLSQMAIVAQEEMLATLGQSLTDDETSLALVSPSGALEAVALGAWTAVLSERTGTKTSTIIEYRSPPEESISPEELGATINETRSAWSKRSLATLSAPEVGQHELWLLLASECGTGPEAVEDTGLRALTMRSLAANFSGTRGVTLLPWVSAEGVGLVGHAPPLRGESPSLHAARVARAVATALAGPPLDGRVVAAQRSLQLDRLGNDPAEILITSILGGGHPSMVAPWGNEKSVATQSTADVERTRDDLVHEPLRLALLTTTETGQKEAARDALSDWLAPLREHPSACGPLQAKPAAPGVWDLETIDEHVQTGATIGVWSPAARTLGKATEFLLNRPNGYLGRALLKPGLAASADARWIGGEQFGGLVIRIGAEAHLLDRAVQQTRILLDQLSAGAISDDDVALALREFQRREEQISRSGAGRLTRLWLSRSAEASSPTPITGASLRSLHKAFSAENHRVVTVRRRK